MPLVSTCPSIRCGANDRTRRPVDSRYLAPSPQDAFLVSASTLPGNIAAALLLDRIGRRRVLSGAMLGACLCAVGFAFLRVAPLTVAFACAFNAFSVAGWNAVRCCTDACLLCISPPLYLAPLSPARLPHCRELPHRHEGRGYGPYGRLRCVSARAWGLTQLSVMALLTRPVAFFAGRVGSMAAQFVNASLVETSVALMFVVMASAMLTGSLSGAALPFEPSKQALTDEPAPNNEEEVAIVGSEGRSKSGVGSTA